MPQCIHKHSWIYVCLEDPGRKEAKEEASGLQVNSQDEGVEACLRIEVGVCVACMGFQQLSHGLLLSCREHLENLHQFLQPVPSRVAEKVFAAEHPEGYASCTVTATS